MPDLTPERAADELAAVSQEPGRGDEPARETADDYADHLIKKLGQLARGDRGYGDGPFDADHIMVFRDDARRLLQRLGEVGGGIRTRAGASLPRTNASTTGSPAALPLSYAHPACSSVSDEQPAPTAREIPADELAEAERAGDQPGAETHLRERLATCKRTPGGHPQSLTDHAIEIVLVEYDQRGVDAKFAQDEVKRLRFLAEALRTELGRLDRMYDERGRERDAAEAEVERARDVRRQIWRHLGRPDGVGLDVELIDAVADAVQSGQAARAEVERLGERLHAAQCRVAELELTPDERAELERLRARDEKATAVVRAWWDRRGVFEQGTELWAALDALARAHEDGAGR